MVLYRRERTDIIKEDRAGLIHARLRADGSIHEQTKDRNRDVRTEPDVGTYKL